MTMPSASTYRSQATKTSLLLGTAALVASTTASAAVSFQPGAVVELAEPSPERVALGDLNGDGHLDAVITCKGTDSDVGAITVWTGDGSGGFTDDAALTGLGHPWGVCVVDLTGDGRPEIVATNGGSGSTAVAVYLNTTSAGAQTPSFQMLGPFTAGAFPIGVAAADFNGDGVMDLAVSNNVTYGLSILLGLGGGQFGPPNHVPNQGGMKATGLDLADFDHDGHADLVVPNYNGFKVFKGLPDGSFQSMSGAMGSSLLSDACVGDFDGDGNDDVAGSAQYGDFVQAFHGNGTFGFASLGSWSTPSWPEDTVAADLNGDGSDDIACTTLDGDKVFVIVSGPSGPETLTMTAATWQPTGIAAGDMNEDGRPDLVYAMANLGDTGQLQVLLNTTIFPPPCAPGDLDCNGTIDGADLGSLLGAWGSSSPTADLNGDGTVDGADLGLLLSMWG
ncbi:MAG: VCBS repeat-containing protein [Phycisphaerales bacterium]|nr:VCBS repeat-containing protein [Phycisphaerales bacterium]